MIIASLLFACMAVCVKLAGKYFHSMELVGYRGLVSSLVLAGIMAHRGESFITPHWKLHCNRSLIGAVSLALWFYSIQGLALATATTLNYTSSIFMAAFALVSGQLMGWQLGAAIFAGFIGVLLILQPSVSSDELLYGLVGLSSGMTAAFAYFQVAALGRAGESENRIVLFFSLACTVLGFIFTPMLGFSKPTDWTAWLWLIPIGLFALGGQWALTVAYAKGTTLLGGTLQYSGVIFSALFGYLVFGDAIHASGILGIALICLAGLWASRATSLSKKA